VSKTTVESDTAMVVSRAVVSHPGGDLWRWYDILPYEIREGEKVSVAVSMGGSTSYTVSNANKGFRIRSAATVGGFVAPEGASAPCVGLLVK
jgi:ferredoxin-NADP reductase